MQHGPSEFTVNIVPDDSRPYEAIQNEVTHRIEEVLGYAPDIHFVRLDSIPRGAGGKLRATVRQF